VEVVAVDVAVVNVYHSMSMLNLCKLDDVDESWSMEQKQVNNSFGPSKSGCPWVLLFKIIRRNAMATSNQETSISFDSCWHTVSAVAFSAHHLGSDILDNCPVVLKSAALLQATAHEWSILLMI